MNVEYKTGTVFFRPLFGDYLKVTKIDTHQINAERKKVKLASEIFTIEYLLNFKQPFTCYKKDVDQMVSFDRWILIKQ